MTHAQCLDASSPGAIDVAVALLRDGKLVALPTETVYGLAARADDGAALARIFAAKGRPSINPLIVHVASADGAERLARLTPLARKLMAAFWPGPLTLVLDRLADAGVHDLACAGLDTIAVRAPAHPVAQAVIAAVGAPLAAPSANRSGGLSPTRARDVLDDLGDRIDAVLDAGDCAHGVESTVVDARGGAPVILRPGGLTREALAACVGPIETAHTHVQSAHTQSVQAPISPGQLLAHYAPRRARVVLDVALGGGEFERPIAHLGFGPGAYATLNLSPSGNLVEAASRLFAYLRILDSAGYRTITVAPIPRAGLGEAIGDRLARAACPAPLAPRCPAPISPTDQIET